MIKILYIFLSSMIYIQTVNAEISIKIINTKGEAKVRFGLEEEWKKALPGINLKEIDTILTGEGGELILQFESGKRFLLGNNSILDIGDLREIQEKELFLFLMSKKVEKIEPRNGKTKLRIGNVSSVYGEDQSKSDTTNVNNSNNLFSKKEINGAIALFAQQYYTNTLYKLHNLLDKYKSKINMGKINFYIANAFEALDKKGQAMDSFQKVIDNFEAIESLSEENTYYLTESKNALIKLKK
jgi:hypothetical protein